MPKRTSNNICARSYDMLQRPSPTRPSRSGPSMNSASASSRSWEDLDTARVPEPVCSIVGCVHPAFGRSVFPLATPVSIPLFKVELAQFVRCDALQCEPATIVYTCCAGVFSSCTRRRRRQQRLRTIARVTTAEERQALCSLIQRADHCMVVGECQGLGRARRQADERTAKGVYFAETPTNSSSVPLGAGLTHPARRLL